MFAYLYAEIAQFGANFPILAPTILVFAGVQIYYQIVVVKPTQLHCKQNSVYQVSTGLFI